MRFDELKTAEYHARLARERRLWRDMAPTALGRYLAAMKATFGVSAYRIEFDGEVIEKTRPDDKRPRRL